MTTAVLPISKLVATGNDFLFIDARADLPHPFSTMARDELGADGLVFVEQRSGQLSWDFYNNDGSVAEMCGNATRCMGRWAQRFLRSSQVEFQTLAGRVRVTSSPNAVESQLDFVRPHFNRITVNGETATLLNTGVPHIVVETPSIESSRRDAARDTQLIQRWRWHASAGEKGANVTFLEIVGGGHFKTVSFERGVEGFTLACGTGVLAAAAVGLKQQNLLRAEVIAPGGRLQVTFNEGFQGANLTGPAAFVFGTEITEEFLK